MDQFGFISKRIANGLAPSAQVYHFKSFSDSRWHGVTASSQRLQGARALGLDANVQHALALDDASVSHLKGYRFLAIGPCKSFVDVTSYTG